MNDIPGSWGTAVNVQSMVFGNMGDTSGTGVAFTRDPSTGEKKLYGEYLMNAQGEDVVAGIRTPMTIDHLAQTNKAVYDQFVEIADRLEKQTKICKIWSLLSKKADFICCRQETVSVPLARLSRLLAIS